MKMPWRCESLRLTALKVAQALLQVNEIGCRDTYHAAYTLYRSIDGIATIDKDFKSLVLPNDQHKFTVVTFG